MSRLWWLTALAISILGCGERTENSLPILGETSIDERTGELVHYKAPSFSYTNQLEKVISNEDFKGKVHVVDFFFSSCASICPQMTNHLKLVQDHFAQEDRLGIISYSIDPENDTPAKLAAYAGNYGIDGDKWALLTGNGAEVFELAKDYKVKAFDDSMGDVPNLIHDGTFVLIDGERRIRGYYDGLEETEVKRLIKDIELLLKST